MLLLRIPTPFFPTINGCLDSIIPVRISLMLSNVKLKMFAFINYPSLQHLLLKMLVDICNPKSYNLLHCNIWAQGAWWLCVCALGLEPPSMAQTDTGRCDRSFLGLNCSQLSWPSWQPIWTAFSFSTPSMASPLLAGLGEPPPLNSQPPWGFKRDFKMCFAGSGLAQTLHRSTIPLQYSI